jgi:serine/threonine-protein kinase
VSDLAELGRFVGKYEILKRLSAGGVAALFLARSSGAGGVSQFVALKQFLPEVRSDEAFTRLFLEEARLTAGLVHPNVGRVLELSLDPVRGDPFVAMEFIAGQSLAELMRALGEKGFQLPVPVACRIVHDVCLGLHAAHVLAGPAGEPLGVVHGDVNPGNVMIRYTGRVQVIDFGFARARHSIRMSRPGQAFGTLGYISPEQVMEHPLDARTDVFAVATVLHELLTGQRLHPNEAAAPRAAVIEQAAPPSSLGADLPPALDAIVLEALEKNPEQRYESAGALARALAAHAPLAEEKEVAALMESLFDARRRATQSLLKSFSEEDDEREAATVSMTVPQPRGAAPRVPPPEGDATRIDRPRPQAPALGDGPAPATQQVSGFELLGDEALWAPAPPAAQRNETVPEFVAPPPPSSAKRPPSSETVPDLFAPPPAPAAPRPPPGSSPRAPAVKVPPPAEAIWAPPPPPAAPRAPAGSNPRAPAVKLPDELFAPPPPPAAPRAPAGSNPRAPAVKLPDELFAPPPPAAPPRAQPGSNPRAPAMQPRPQGGDELFAPPPAPAASPRPPPKAAAPPPMDALWAPPPGATAAPAAAPLDALWAPPPGAQPAAPAAAHRAPVQEEPTRPPRTKRPTQPRIPTSELPPPAPLFTDDTPPVGAFTALWDKIRWVVAMVLLIAAIGVVTAWFRTPPSILPRPPPDKVAQ